MDACEQRNVSWGVAPFSGRIAAHLSGRDCVHETGNGESDGSGLPDGLTDRDMSVSATSQRKDEREMGAK